MGGGGAQVVRNATAGEAGPCPASVAALIRYLATKDKTVRVLRKRNGYYHAKVGGTQIVNPKTLIFFFFFEGGPECAGHSFAYFTHFVFMRDVWIRT
jgi:hypothetical protein